MVDILSKKKHTALLEDALPGHRFADAAEDLAGGDVLIAYLTGVIVPAGTLRRYRRAYNFHGGTPQYPGRDPHHWAAYDRAARFGATAHVMEAEIDAGAIVGVIQLGCDSIDPGHFHDIGLRCAAALFLALAPAMAQGTAPPLADTPWSGVRRRRQDLLAACDLAGLDPDERARRMLAFAGFEHAFRG